MAQFRINEMEGEGKVWYLGGKRVHEPQTDGSQCDEDDEEREKREQTDCDVILYLFFLIQYSQNILSQIYLPLITSVSVREKNHIH